VENSSLIWSIISIFHFWRKSFKNWDIYKKLRFFRKCLKKVIFLEVDFSKINFGEWYTTMIVCTLWEKCEYYFFQFDYISVIIDKLIYLNVNWESHITFETSYLGNYWLYEVKHKSIFKLICKLWNCLCAFFTYVTISHKLFIKMYYNLRKFIYIGNYSSYKI